MNPLTAFVALIGSLVLRPTTATAETVGKRPYELDWAKRTEDHCPPLVDFEELTGWHVECRDAVANFERTREQQIWGAHVGKLTYRGTGPSPEVRIVPPQPLAIDHPFDAVTLWCYGNNWGWTTDPSTPRVGISALFEDQAGQELSVFLYTVDWKEWNLLHKRLTPQQIQRVKAGAKFKGLLITGGKNVEDRVLYFDNLAVFTEKFPPLTFDPRPKRGIDMLPGGFSEVNNGRGRLPFPNRAQTILPVNLTKHFTNSISVESSHDMTSYVFTYKGADGRLVYRLTPATGTWSDLVVECKVAVAAEEPDSHNGRLQIRPCMDGGVYLETAKGPTLPERVEHLGTDKKRNQVESRWRLSAQSTSVEVTYIYRLWNKSLVIDVLAPGGGVAEVRFGRAAGSGFRTRAWSPTRSIRRKEVVPQWSSPVQPIRHCF